MIIVGGCYREICEVPDWRRLFGSGARAAAAVGPLSPGSELVGYVCKDWARDFERSAATLGVSARLTEIEEDISFSYFHSMSDAALHPEVPKSHSLISVAGETVLRFGFVEGDAVVKAKRAIHDPQTGGAVRPFRENGSTADTLAVVLNEWEAMQATKLRGDAAGAAILDLHSADVVIVKRGPRGATVYTSRESPRVVPAYWSERIFKIGSGDVFSAAFALYWGERGLDAVEAADNASRCVAHYVDSRVLPLPGVGLLRTLRPLVARAEPRQIYLAGPFFDIAQRWLIEEARSRLSQLEVPVFSPFHDVGTGRSAREMSEADLRGLDESGAVLALLDGVDPGSVFEVGYACAKGKRVLVLGEHLEEHHLTMLVGTGCDIISDFVSAVYRTAWESWSS